MKTISFSAMWSTPLGAEIRNRALAQCPNGYPMTIRDKNEYAAIAQAWNVGIDSYLEALTDRSSANEGKFLIHPEELHTLVRRLMEDVGNNEEEDPIREAAESLASGICQTLGIELV